MFLIVIQINLSRVWLTLLAKVVRGVSYHWCGRPLPRKRHFGEIEIQIKLVELTRRDVVSQITGAGRLEHAGFYLNERTRISFPFLSGHHSK